MLIIQTEILNSQAAWKTLSTFDEGLTVAREDSKIRKHAVE